MVSILATVSHQDVMASSRSQRWAAASNWHTILFRRGCTKPTYLEGGRRKNLLFPISVGKIWPHRLTFPQFGMQVQSSQQSLVMLCTPRCHSSFKSKRGWKSQEFLVCGWLMKWPKRTPGSRPSPDSRGGSRKNLRRPVRDSSVTAYSAVDITRYRRLTAEDSVLLF